MKYSDLGAKYLGKKWRDTVNDIEGTATGVQEYLNGCVRVTLELMSPKRDELMELTFDEARLVEVKARPAPVKPAKTGGPRQTPPRTGARA